MTRYLFRLLLLGFLATSGYVACGDDTQPPAVDFGEPDGIVVLEDGRVDQEPPVDGFVDAVSTDGM